MSGSVRDVLVVAWYGLARSLRTRAALGILVLYVLCTTGGAWAFRQILKVLETAAARGLGVPATDKPGAMIDELIKNQDFPDLLEAMVGNRELVDWAVTQPYMAIASFWTGLAITPFIAAAVGAEALAPDVADRSIRFELARTGRIELVSGRWLARALLLLIATIVAVLGPWAVGVFAMLGTEAWPLLGRLLADTPRLWCWALPFLGWGVTCSQLVRNVNAARLLATLGVAASWIAWWFTEHELADKVEVSVEASVIGPLYPQSWILGLWGPGWEWVGPACGLAVIGFAAVLPGYLVFERRDV